MINFFCSALKFMIFVPGMLLAYLPMKQYLQMRPAKLLPTTLFLILLLGAAGGIADSFLDVSTVWLLFPTTVIMGIYYVRTLRITRWKSVSVFLAICGAFSCIGNTAIGINSVLNPTEPAHSLPFHTALYWFLLCCVFVAAVWYPATHAARKLLEEDAFAQTWYVFWILPLLFIGLNLVMVPRIPGIMKQGRLRQLYILFSFALLFLLLLFYMLFYLMASSLNRIYRLRMENQFLYMQQTRYDSLHAAIEQTRQARHDMRHHFHILQRLAAQEEWENLRLYLAEIQGSIPDGDLGFCKNTFVDGVASYFMALYREQDIPLTFALYLPNELPVSETDLCSVLSNLLENALEASLKLPPERRQVKASARLHLNHMVLLSVENTYDGKIREKDGVILSSKRPGEGIGLQAVRHTAEKTGGYSRFLYDNGTFRADIILQGVK